MAVPDPLHRFVPTRHRELAGRTLIESNDANFVQHIQLMFQAPIAQSFHITRHLKIVIDHSVTSDGVALTSIECGLARTILRGTNTVVFYDSGTREVLAFLAPEVSPREFVQRLLPAALAFSEELQTSDMDCIAS